MATTVRVDDNVAARLRKLALAENRSIGNVINDALEQYEAERFWRETSEAYSRLHADEASWRSYQNEVRAFEGGSMDGLQEDEPYYSAEEVEEILGKRS